ncbi:MAG: T9SS type A sorting domain-containing protein [Saprospiraceae bacterium]|nr:T9SS type A sorting domain-containing protein [Saprospiraceae bacterium]
MKTLLTTNYRFLKHSILIIGIMLFSSFSFSQITIGNGNNVIYDAPVYGYYDYSWSAQIYLNSELSGAAKINALEFQVSNTISNYQMFGQKIYIKEIPDSMFYSADYINPNDIGAVKVFDGSFTWNSGWNTIYLQTPYQYSGSGHLLILWENHDGSWTNDRPEFYGHPSYQRLKTNSTDGNFPYFDGSISYYRPNIKIHTSAPYAIDLAMLEWTSPVNGTSPNANMPISVKFKNNGTANASGFNLLYSVDEGVTIVTETYTGTVYPGDTVNYTFTNTANMSVNGIYYGGAVVSHPSDSFRYNDTIGMQLSICNILSGSYTINNMGGGDFNSINDATTALMNCGISGSVVFNIANGTYNENISIGYIPGASSTNTITFQSQSGDSTAVIIQGNQGAPWNIYSSFIKLKRLSFKCSQYDDNPIIQIAGGCNNIDINNCVILGADVYHSSDYSSVINITNGTHHNINITNNIINDGSYGIYIQGLNSYSPDSGNVFSYNQLNNQFTAGIFCKAQNAAIINNNNISTSKSNNYYLGIYSYNGLNGTRINANTINVYNTGCEAGISLNMHNFSGTIIDSAIVSNNTISINYQSSTPCYGIYDYNTVNTLYTFNSINIYGNGYNSYSFYKDGYNNTHIKNNIFFNQTGGYTFYSNAQASYLNMNYNNLYSTSQNLAYLGNYYSSLSAWKAGTGLSTNGISTNPNFVSNTNLHPSSISMNNKGTVISGITVDQDNNTRHATTPDIGAYEYSPAANDLAVIGWAGSSDLCALSSTEQVKVNIVNNGTSSQSNFNIVYSLNQGTNITETYTGTIISGDTLTYTFTNTADLSSPGWHLLSIFTNLANDQNLLNDTLNWWIKKIGTIIPPFYEDFEDSTSLYLRGYRGSEAKLNLTTEYNGDSWVAVRMQGKSNTGWNYPTNVTDAFANNPEHFTKLYSCDINTTGMSVLRLMFDYQNESTYDIKNNWFRVMINGTSYAKAAFTGDSVWQPNNTDDHSNNETLEFDLSSYIGGNITISLEAVLCYDEQGSGYGMADEVYIDNIRLWEPALHDVGVLNITSSGGECGSETDSIYAIIRNFGLSSETNIPVYCSIQADDGFHSYNATYTDTIPSFGMDYVYLGIFNTTQNGYFDVIGYTNLTTDTVNRLNDTAKFYGENEHHKTIPFIEDFENGDNDWNYNGFYVQDGGFFGLTSKALFADVYQQYMSISPPSSGSPVTNAPYEAQMRRSIGKVTTESYLVFDYAVMGNLNYDDSIIVSLSNDCRNTYNKVYKINNSNYWNGQGLHQTAIPIADYAGEYVYIQVSLFNGNQSSYMVAIDNIGIIDAVQVDLGNDTTICQGETVILDAGYNSNPAYKHNWMKNGILLSDTSSTITVGTSGTYISFVTDSLNFTGSDTINIVVSPKPNVNIISGLNSAYCRSEMPVNLLAYPTGGTFSGDGLTGNYFNPSSANIGNNLVVYSYTDNYGCSNSDTIQTIVNALPTVNISTVLSSAYCSDASSVSLTATPSGGIFSGPGISANTFNPSMANGTVNIFYNYTDTNGCSNTDTVSTVVNQNPYVIITTSPASNYCSNSAIVNLTAYPSGGTFSGDGISGSTFNPATALIGSNQIIYNYTNVSGCTGSDTIVTNVTSAPIVNISTVLASAYCEDASPVSLSATPSGGVFSGSGVSGNTFNPSLANGLVNIFYNYTDVNACSNTDTISTTVNQNPFVIITSSLASNYCTNSPTVSLTAYPSGGTFTGNGISGSVFNPASAIVGSNQLIYTYNAVSGCSGADTVSTIVNSLPTVTLSSFADICENQSQLILSGGSPANGDYSGAGVASSSGVFYPSITGPGLIPITYSFTDANGCTAFDTKNLKVVSSPTSNFSVPSNVCPNSMATITYQGTAGSSANFNWNFDYGVINSGSGSGPYQVSWDTSGVKQLSLNVVDSGCTSTTSYNYTNVLNKTASITAIGSTTVCFGDSVILFANSGFGYSYQWLFNSTILPNDTNSFLAANLTGDYSVLVTNNYLCTDTSNTISVMINPLPIANFSVISNACTGNTITVTYTGNASSAATYNWNFDNAIIISGSGQGPYQIKWNSAGTKVISLVVSENNCVSSTHSSNVIINSTEAIITSIGSTTFCNGDSVALYANTGTNLAHQWYKNNNIIAGATNPFYIANSGGLYHVVVTNTVTGCSKSSTPKTITVNTNNFNLAFTATPNSFTAPPFIVSFNNQTPNSSNYYFYWDLGDGNNSTFMQPFHTYQFDGTYDVTLIAENISTGCRDTLVKPNYISCTGGSPNPCSVVANISPSGSAIICVNDSLLLSANAGSGWNYQWLRNGVVIQGADTSSIYAKLAGEYRVIVNDTVCSRTSNPFILGNHPSVIPVISSNDSIRPCTNDSMELFVNTFYNSYLWSTGQTTQSIYVKYSGNYTITTTDINSCALVSTPFIVNASLLQPPEICIVGVDSSNHNRIIWERSSSALVDSFFIYRESTAAGVYNKIGQVDNTQPSIFVDMNSNPAVRAYRYRLTASDTCGSETAMSPYHKTMHLTINKGLPGTYNLIWDGYHGFQFGSYAIYRGADSASMTLLTQIQSTLSSYTDLNPPGDTVFYQIEILSPHGCYPDSIFSKANTNFNSSRSNVANTIAVITPDTTGIHEIVGNNLGVNIFPNPNNGKFVIHLLSPAKENLQLSIFNTLGKLIYKEDNIVFEGEYQNNFDLENMPKGIYFVRLINEEMNIVRKVIIQ